MERLQGPINPCHFFGDHLDLQCLEQGMASITAESLRYEEEEGTQYLSMPGLEDTVPFLQMLQNVDCPPFNFPMKEPSFQALLKLQHVKTTPWSQMQNTQIQTLEALESCVTHDNQQMYSPVKSEGKDHHQNPHSVSDCNQDLKPNSAEMGHDDQTQYTKSAQATRERKKRKRTRPAKNKEEVESQRMTHIAVERNRRKQMNDHLSVLRSLMPPSYIQRGDQASIVGGAIDFVKELEQHLQSLEAQKRMRKCEGNGDHSNDNPSSSSSPSSSYIACPPNGMFMSMSQCRIGSIEELGNNSTFRDDGTLTAQNKSEAANVYATVIQSHVNLKVQCKRRPSQLMRAIAALEDLRLTVLHLNINSSEDMILYSFNLKIEEACNLGSADEIAIAVQQIFSFINNN